MEFLPVVTERVPSAIGGNDFCVLSFRPAAPREQRALEALQRKASLIWEEQRAALLANPDAIELPLKQIFEGRVNVAERDGIVVGFSVLTRRDDGDAELDGLFVDPSRWREGIGSQLVREAERRAVEERATFLHVIANPRAEAFYTACGFAFVGVMETRFGPAPAMRKALESERVGCGDRNCSGEGGPGET